MNSTAIAAVTAMSTLSASANHCRAAATAADGSLLDRAEGRSAVRSRVVGCSSAGGGEVTGGGVTGGMAVVGGTGGGVVMGGAGGGVVAAPAG